MKKIGIPIFLVLGFAVFYFIWPRSLELPKISVVEDWPFTEVSGMSVDPDKPKVLTFIFTNCPDICPMTIWDLKDLQELMKEKGYTDEDYQLLAVTLDPEYDTKQVLENYKTVFDITDPNWLFLRGSMDDTEKLTKSVQFYYEKDSNGFVTHSTTLYILDSEDRVRALHDMAVGNKRVNVEQVARHLEMLIKR